MMQTMTRSRLILLGVPLSVLALAAGLRLWGLTQPTNLYWDEQHYVWDAEAYLGGGIGLDVGTPPGVRIADEGTWIHPPLGKWMMALLGVGPLGHSSLGWRLPSALFGIAGVALLYLLALKLWGSVWWAALAGLLLALDGLHIVQSRIAMLDIFLTTFVIAGMLLLVLDRLRGAARPTDNQTRSWIDRTCGSRYRLGAGIAFGAALATKWAGVFALGLALVLCVVWQRSERAGTGRERDLAARVRTIAIPLLLVPLILYLFSYGAFFYQHGPAISAFASLHLEMLRYHLEHTQVQPQSSEPWTWPLLLHPIQYFGLQRPGEIRRIVALGNPALWWGFLAILPAGLLSALRRRTWQDAVAFGGYAALFLPWLLVRRSQFIFYMLPAVPFMSLVVVATLRRVPSSFRRRSAVVFASAVASAAAVFAPAWLGLWAAREWLDGVKLLPDWPL